MDTGNAKFVIIYLNAATNSKLEQIRKQECFILKYDQIYFNQTERFRNKGLLHSAAEVLRPLFDTHINYYTGDVSDAKMFESAAGDKS